MARFPGSSLARALALTASLAITAPAYAEGNWATARAEELCSQASAHRVAGDVSVAIDRYRQALEIDPTFGPAYLGLGGLREATGDTDEAEKTYAAGIDHVAGFADGFLARGALRLRAGRGDAALDDLLAALALRTADVEVVRKVLDASIALGRLPLALATARRLIVLSVADGDAATEHEARVTASALTELIAFADPVADGENRNPVRRALARALGRRRPADKRASTASPSGTKAPVESR